MASTRTVSVFEPSPSGSAAARLLTGQHRGNSAPTIEPERSRAVIGLRPGPALVDGRERRRVPVDIGRQAEGARRDRATRAPELSSTGTQATRRTRRQAGISPPVLGGRPLLGLG